MLSVEIFVPSDTMEKVRSLLATCDGVDRIVIGGTSVNGDHVLVTAELRPQVVDVLLPQLVACGVPGDGISIVHRDGQRPVGRAFLALGIGLAAATTATFVVTASLRVAGYPPANTSLGDGGLGPLPTVNVVTLVVAAVAGIAGVLAFRTRSSVAVGVAISITTIPAAAFIGAALAVGHGVGLRDALSVLTANVGMILVTGTATLALQLRREQR